MNNNFKFIVFEGIDGCGKTTLVNKTFEYLNSIKKDNVQIFKFREPGGTVLGEKIRDILINNEAKGLSELLLFLSARSTLFQEKIIPLYDSNKKTIIIFDRFVASTIAYQFGLKKILYAEDIYKLNEIATNKIKPNIQFWIDTSLKTIEKRTSNKSLDAFEESINDSRNKLIEYYSKLFVRETWLRKFTDGENVYVNGNQSVEKIMENIIVFFRTKEYSKFLSFDNQTI